MYITIVILICKERQVILNRCLSIKKIKVFFLFFILISFVNPAVLAENMFSESDSGNYLGSDEDLQFTYDFQKPVLSQTLIAENLFTDVSLNNLSSNQGLGEPKLPVKTVKILLPPRTSFSDVSVSSSQREIKLDYPICVNEFTGDSSIKNQLLKKDSMHQLDSDDSFLFPSENVNVVGVGKLRGYLILLVNVYPCQYNVNNDSLVFSSQISFSIETVERQQNHELFRDLSKDKQFIEGIVENPEMMSLYSSENLNSNQESSNANSNFEYIVITSDELESSFNSLITYKQQYISARTVNLSFITSNFYAKDIQGKIREFICYAYSYWQTEYVLLGGDVSIIPYRGLWGHAVDHTDTVLQETGIPADIYYAGLDGSWDADEDNRYGEDKKNSTSEEADFFAEVYVGRAPVENKAEVGTFINKVITYETTEKPKRVLLHQSGINTDNEPDSTVIPERCARWIPHSYEINRLYQVNESISSSLWMSAFANENMIVQHTGNGEIDQYYVSWPTEVFTSYQSVSMLKNNFYPIHTSVSCDSGAFEYDDCIAETILLNPYGGSSACLFNSRRGFTSELDAHKYSGELIEQQFRNIFYHDVESLGKVHQYAKEAFAINAIVNPAYRWCYYTLNLLGDPEMPVLEKREEYLNSNHFYVDDDYSQETLGWNVTHFDTIQKGIDAASNWDVVHVKNGTYNEYISIKKTVQLIGEDKKSTIIDGDNGRGPIRISANRVTVEGFTIKNDALSPDACRIHIKNSNYVTISDCVISDNSVGIYASETTNLFIVNNNFERNGKSIFCPMKMGTIYISNNLFSLGDDDTYGLYGMAKGDYILHNNSFISDTIFTDFSCAVRLNGDAELRLNDIQDFSIGVWLSNGDGVFEQNHIVNNYHIGLYAASSSVQIIDNVIENNGNNWITYQYSFEPGGIILNGNGGQTCIVRYNIIKDNRGWGIWLKGYLGFDNLVENNDFIDNSRNAFFKNSFCSWKRNFWDKERLFPKIIVGVFETDTLFLTPFFNVDFTPRSFHLQ